jgi:NADH-quinone oxidoreductase subunit N
MSDHSLTLVLPGLVVIGTALVLLLVDLVVSRKAVLAWIASGGLVAAAVVALAQWVRFDNGSLTFQGSEAQSAFDGMVAFDKYGLYAVLLFCGIGVLTVLLSDAYITRHHDPHGEYYGLLLLVIAGMIGMAISTDVIALFISFELMSLPTYVLAGSLRADARSGEASVKYFVNGAFASAILAFGLALLYGATGQTNYAGIAEGLAGLGGETSGIWAVALVLVVVGFGFKVSAVPFHSWAPDVYEGAPTPVTAFMSVGVKAGAFLGFLKLFTVAMVSATGAAAEPWTIALIILAVLTMVVGNVLALPQRNLKRMLAYSSIAHAGYLMLGLIAVGGSGDSGGSSAILFYLAAYTAMNLGAFGVLVWIRNRRAFGYTLDEITGLSRSMPLPALALSAFMLSLTGIPPTIGFWGKFYLFTAVVDAGYTWLAIIAVLMSAVSAFYYLRVVWLMYFHERPEELTVEPDAAGRSLGVGVALGISVVGVLIVGLYPQPLLRAAEVALRVVVGG